MLVYSVLLCIGVSTINCLTCSEVQDFPPQKIVTLEELQSMPSEDIIQCLKHIAQKPLPATDSRYIWEVMIDFYNGIPYIPERVLAHLRWVTPAIEADEYENITIGTINVVKNFGFPYDLDSDKLAAIAKRVRDGFSGKMPEHYTFYDLRALHQILCAFKRSEIDRIHPTAYMEAASIIGRLKKCDSDVLLGFAHLAVHKKAFGPSQNWTGLVLKTVGNVAKYLPGGITKEFEKRIRDDDDEPYEVKEPADEY